MPVEHVVDHESLQFQTQRGWVVVERFEVHEPVFVDEPDPATVNLGYRSTIPVFKGVYPKPMFRIRLDDGSALAALHKELDVANNELREKGDKLSVIQKENDQLTKDLESTKGALTRQLEEQRINASSLRREQETRRKLEIDIGKIREVLGRERFDAIIPPVVPEKR